MAGKAALAQEGLDLLKVQGLCVLRSNTGGNFRIVFVGMGARQRSPKEGKREQNGWQSSIHDEIHG
jgi:hypothetical protein